MDVGRSQDTVSVTEYDDRQKYKMASYRINAQQPIRRVYYTKRTFYREYKQYALVPQPAEHRLFKGDGICFFVFFTVLQCLYVFLCI